MSDNISSSVLFHLTSSLGDLKSILKDGFFPHYCPEYTLNPIDLKAVSKRLPPSHAVPMVSFCDLPLSLMRKHLKEYGKFGIGLKKQWGIKNGVAPVIYTHSKAKTRAPVLRLTEKTTNKSVIADMRFLAAHTKPFRGPAWRKNQVQKRVRFYDEREWRYVPSVRRSKPLFLDWKEYSNPKNRNAIHNEFKQKYALPISPDDIQYLIVAFDKGENNVLELHDYIMRLYGRRYGRKQAILVTTAIMTDDCIREDI